MKKRKNDLIFHKDIHSIGIFTIIFTVICVFAIGTNSNFFSETLEKINSISILNKKNDLLIGETISDIDKLHYNDKQNYDKKIFENLNIVAKSYVVYDVKNKNIIYAKNSEDVLPLASLTKVVSAVTAVNLAKENKEIVIKSSLMRKDESLDIGMSEGQIWKLSDLLKYALTISSNSSMDIIASTVSDDNQKFIDEMNLYMKELGFKNFNFNSASGLDYGEVIGGVGTAKEYAEFFAKSYELIPDILSYTINSKVDLSGLQKIYQVPNTNKEASKTVGLLASKTGFTDAAGGNLAIMFNFRINRPIVIVVLDSTVEDRFKDVNKLYFATIKSLQ